MSDSIIDFYSGGEVYFKKEYWSIFIGWNIYLNYDIDPPYRMLGVEHTVIVYYNYYSRLESNILNRTLYLPFKYKGTKFKVVYCN